MLKTIQVLIVDDSTFMRKSLSSMLTKDPRIAIVGMARNGEEALFRMQGISGPATAVVDLMMPDMNGWQLVEKMGADAGLSRIPIIICTAHGGSVAGAHTLLNKPVGAKELLFAVRESFKR